MWQLTSRRRFLGQALGCAGSALAYPAFASLPAAPNRMYTSVKWGMITEDGDAAQKFQLCKELGLDGMELVSPLDGFTISEAREASRLTGLPVHGVVGMKHWDVRLSSPAAEERGEAVQILGQAIRDASALGGDSVLLVPGKVAGSDETHDHVWDRSQQGIRQVLPLASKVGVRVLIENVWNGFCETPEQLRDYIDEMASPWVGVYFDIGNVAKFGPSQDWIRTLGNRIVKLDVKDWGVEQGFCKIGEGDVDWPEVRKALGEIGFTGWCTAEVPGGGRDRLAEIVERMNSVLGLPLHG